MAVATNEHDEDSDRIVTVPFVPFRCPRCGRHKPATHGVHGRIRHHVCRACGQRYRSFEVGPDSVRGWAAPSGV